jgi:hypothetical protein
MPKEMTEEAIQSYLQSIKETPDRIRRATMHLDETRLATPLAPKEWSAVQILAHLRAGADVWGYSIYAMLTLDTPEMADIHPRAWDKMQAYAQLSFAENLQAFEIERRNLVRVLGKLSFAAWGREGRFIGKVNVHSIFSQTMRLASHELDHCQQLETSFSSES